MLRPFMPQIVRNGPPRSSEFGLRESPRLSIVVPLSGEPLYVIALLAQQDRWHQRWALRSNGFSWRRGSRSRLPRPAAFPREIGLMAAATLVLAETPEALGATLNCGALAARADLLCFLDESSWLLSGQQVGQALAAVESGAVTAVSLAAEWDDGHPDSGECARFSQPASSFCFASLSDYNRRELTTTGVGLLLHKRDWSSCGGFSTVVADCELVGPDFSGA